MCLVAIMIGSLHFWLRLFLLALACLMLIWIGVKSAKRRRAKSGTSLSEKPPKRITVKAATAIGLSLFAAGFVSGFRAPHGTEDHYVKIHLIKAGAQPQSFWADLWREGDVRPDEGWATFCPDFPTPFVAGMTLKDVYFENRGHCWSVAGRKHGYYIINRQENGTPILEAMSP